MTEFDFVKAHGQGNNYIYFRDLPDGIDLQGLAVRVSDKNFGIGSDGMVLVSQGKSSDLIMRMWNNDGTEAEMCGTALRSVCYLEFLKTGKKEFSVQTKAGFRKGFIEDDLSVTVSMGEANILEDSLILQANQKSFKGTWVEVGNPHFVIYNQDITQENISLYGSLLEKHSHFPHRCNIEFVKIISENEIKVDVWERGSGITLACGTGACASAYVGMKAFNLKNSVLVKLPGGFVRVFLDKDQQLYLSGRVEIICKGIINIS